MTVSNALAGVTALAAYAVFSSLGCNTLLGNEEGTARAGIEGGAPAAPDAGPSLDAGVVRPTCDTTQGNKVCFGVCVKIDQPNTGCGSASCSACDPKNAVTTTCKGGASTLVCGYAECRPGFDSCDGVQENGCETSLGLSTSCGSCATKCLGNTPFCAPTAGGAACVDSCPGMTTECSGACVDTRTSIDNCGKCGIKCERASATATCDRGMCTYACAAGTHACGNVCASDIDPRACGASCIDCPATQPNTRATCGNGTCGITCMAGFLDCDGSPKNGCEVNANACSGNGSCGGATCGPLQQCCDGVCISNIQVCRVISPPILPPAD